jgi:hypothetical protein
MTHRRRRTSDTVKEIIIVQTSDGARLRCSVATVGRGTEPRWMILDSKGQQFVGPRVGLDRSEEGVQRLINDWWLAEAKGEKKKDTKKKKPDAEQTDGAR